MSLSKMARCSLGILICLGAATVASAQSTVTINGTVKDQTGAAVASATVVATNVSTGIKNELTDQYRRSIHYFEYSRGLL